MNKTTLTLTNNCRFHLGDCPDAWQSWYDDSDWDNVSLPHDWSVTLPFSKEYSSGTGYLAGGIGWYRIKISPNKDWIGKRISLSFDGIYKNSQIWCNSYYLGERPNGYIYFNYDVTEQFNFDKDNIISIKVDRREISDSRWFTGSGIIRKVSLVIEEPVHLLADGVAFTTPEVSKDNANFVIRNEVINTLEDDCKLTVENKLISKNKTISVKATKMIPANQDKVIETIGSIESPDLWSPETPNLYTLETWFHIEQDDGTKLSYLSDCRKVGVRSIRFDAGKGFFLNEEPTIIKGVCVHHDAGCLGASVPPAVWSRRLEKLKAVGCNTIRMSHNPHMPELYDLCDLMGFLVIDEAFDEWEGPKNKWSTGHNVYPPKHQGYYLDFPQWYEEDLKSQIRKNRCHPSIIMWSIGNEIDYPNDPYAHPSFDTMTGNNDANKPIQERIYNPERPDATRLAVLAERLSKVTKDIDSSRPVTLAAAFPELSSTIGFFDYIDVVGYNYKEQFYEESHLDFPNKPLFGSENNHSYEAWKAVTDNPYIFGQCLWTGFDFLGEAQGWPIRGSRAGILDLAGFEKTSYYRRQSFWSSEPVVHISTTCESDEGEFTALYDSWNYQIGQDVLVKCYSNLNEITFFLNDRNIGSYTRDHDKDCISLTIPFETGTLTAKGITDDGSVVSHSLTTTGSACQIDLHCWEDDISGDLQETPLYQVELTMKDSDNNIVTSDSTRLHVTVENGILLGLENGDQADVSDYSNSYRRAYKGRLLIYARPIDETINTVITVKGENLKTATINLN